MEIRKGLYRIGIMRSEKLDVPVIVVGGISAGGSGKTPLVITLVKRLSEKGYRPGVISRGYRGNSDHWPRQVSDSTTADLVGDEPQLIFERTGVPVIVGPDRIEDGRMLIRECGCDVLLSDDGFQHFRLCRDLDIVVVDASTGLGSGWCLPAGPLREPASALHRAGLVVVNGIGDVPRLPAGATRMTMHPDDCYNLASGETRSLDSFSGSAVHVVAGIGNPERFFRQLQEQGLKIKSHPFPDHHRFLQSDLDFPDPAPILMTEKDGIKCTDMAIAGQIWVVRARVDLDPDIVAGIERVLKQAGVSAASAS